MLNETELLVTVLVVVVVVKLIAHVDGEVELFTIGPTIRPAVLRRESRGSKHNDI